MQPVSLKRTPADKKAIKADAKRSGFETDPGDFSYGTSFTLGEQELSKLGLDTMPAAGDEVTMVGRGTVRTTSTSTDGGDDKRSLEVQITHLAVEPKANASKMYDKPGTKE